MGQTNMKMSPDKVIILFSGTIWKGAENPYRGKAFEKLDAADQLRIQELYYSLETDIKNQPEHWIAVARGTEAESLVQEVLGLVASDEQIADTLDSVGTRAPSSDTDDDQQPVSGFDQESSGDGANEVGMGDSAGASGQTDAAPSGGSADAVGGGAADSGGDGGSSDQTSGEVSGERESRF